MDKHYQKDFYLEALELFRSKVTEPAKIRELLILQNPDYPDDIDKAIVRLKNHRRNLATKYLIAGIVMFLLGLAVAKHLINKAGIIELAIIAIGLGCGIGALGKGASEYLKIR